MATKRYKLKESAVPMDIVIQSLKNRTGFEVDPNYLYPEECDLVTVLELNDALDEFEELIYESDLPKSLTKSGYDAWYAQSKVIDGVRMGPPVSCEGVTESLSRKVQDLEFALAGYDNLAKYVQENKLNGKAGENYGDIVLKEIERLKECWSDLKKLHRAIAIVCNSIPPAKRDQLFGLHAEEFHNLIK